MTWEVLLHPAVRDTDLPALPGSAVSAILKAIRRKLATDPLSFGEPLRRELFGYRKLRVGDYRIIYRIERAAVRVLVVKVGARKDNRVYEEMLKRARKLAKGS